MQLVLLALITNSQLLLSIPIRLLVEDPRLSEAVYDFQQAEAYVSVWSPPKVDCQAIKGLRPTRIPYFYAKASGEKVRQRRIQNESFQATGCKSILSGSRTSDFFSLIVFKSSHPWGPVGRLNAAGCGPDTLNIEVAVPIERPKLLQIYLPHIKIQKDGIYGALVPVDAN